MTFDELVNASLLGTGRAAPPPTDDTSDLDEQLTAALAAARSSDAAETMLASAAVLSAYEICGSGFLPATASVLATAEADLQLPCRPGAAAILDRLLLLPANSTNQALIAEWLSAARHAGHRAPHELLPALLDFAADHRDVRDAVAAVIDRRGSWLMALNPRWQFAAVDTPAAETWATGNPEQRAASLCKLRTIDPAAALTLLQSTWKDDPADERAAIVAILATHLTLADETFLEAALDDRSKQVRIAAADLLSRLDGSAHVQRMIDRVDALLTLVPAEPSRLLRKAKPAVIEVELPSEPFDPAWARDGVLEKTPTPPGRRQSWLSQMLQCVPPSHWSRKWQLSPHACVAAAAEEDRALLTAAWAKAAERHRDIEWMTALAPFPGTDESPLPFVSTVRHLHFEGQRHVLPTILNSEALTLNRLADVLSALSGRLDADSSAAAVNAMERLTRLDAGPTAGVGYRQPPPPGLAAALTLLAMRIDPAQSPGLSTRWSGPAWVTQRKALDEFFNTLQTRSAIEREFSQ